MLLRCLCTFATVVCALTVTACDRPSIKQLKGNEACCDCSCTRDVNGTSTSVMVYTAGDPNRVGCGATGNEECAPHLCLDSAGVAVNGDTCANICKTRTASPNDVAVSCDSSAIVMSSVCVNGCDDKARAAIGPIIGVPELLYEVDPAASTVSVTVPDHDPVAVTVREATIGTRGTDCTNCSSYSSFTLILDNFRLAGDDVTGARLSASEGILMDSVSPGLSFGIPEASLITYRFSWGPDFGSGVIPVPEMLEFDETGDGVVLSGAVSLQGVHVEFNLVGRMVSAPPTATIGTTPFWECTSRDGTTVALDGSQSSFVSPMYSA